VVYHIVTEIDQLRNKWSVLGAFRFGGKFSRYALRGHKLNFSGVRKFYFRLSKWNFDTPVYALAQYSLVARKVSE